MKWNIIGLGNPGDEYANTLHNAGRLCVQLFAKEQEINSIWKKDKILNAYKTNFNIDDKNFSLFLPETFMNNSGEAVRKIVRDGGVENLIVVYDDVSIPLGKIKISYDRGSGGHNGIASISKMIGTTKFLRIRIGIESPDENIREKIKKERSLDEYVLHKINSNQKELLQSSCHLASSAILAIAFFGKEIAMTKFN